MANILAPILIIVVLFEVTQHGDCAGCLNQRLSSMKLTIISKRNQTGHWTAQAQLEHGSEISSTDEPSTTPWTLNLEQNTAQCDGLESVILVATVTAPPPKAGPGYVFYRNVGYYKMHTTPKTWQEAREICNKEGAHLAIINSEEESKVIQDLFEQLIPDKKTVWAFIGFHDRYVEGQYLTLYDEPLSTTGFTRWSSAGQPDNYGGNSTYTGEDCGSVHRNGGMNDLPCGARVPFFCEQELWHIQERPEIKGYTQCAGNLTADNVEENVVLGNPV